MAVKRNPWPFGISPASISLFGWSYSFSWAKKKSLET